jgi:hypothetical protein
MHRGEKQIQESFPKVVHSLTNHPRSTGAPRAFTKRTMLLHAGLPQCEVVVLSKLMERSLEFYTKRGVRDIFDGWGGFLWVSVAMFLRLRVSATDGFAR